MKLKNIFNKLFLLVTIPVLLMAQTGLLNPYTIADITGASTTTALAASYTPAKLIQFTTPAANTASIRYGDSNTSATRGTPVVSGAQNSIGASGNGYFNLANVYVYIATGDKLSVMYWYGN